MKIPVFIAAALILASCGSAEEIIDEVSDELNLPDRIASGRATSYAYNLDHSDSTMSRIDYQYYTPQLSSGVMDSSYKDSVNDRTVFLASLQSPDSETELLGPLTDYYFERVVEDFTVDEADDDDEVDMWRWSMEASFEISEMPSYVQLMAGGWSYTGGAHGNGYTLYEYFSKETGEYLDLDYFISDLDAVLPIAEKHFRIQQEIGEEESLEEIGFWFENGNFELNHNFYFTEDHMVFVYNPYEIAPYAAGTIILEIPLTELEGKVQW